MTRPRVAVLTTPTLPGAMIADALAAESGLEVVAFGLYHRVYKGVRILGGGPGHRETARRFIRRSGLPYSGLMLLFGDIGWGLLKPLGKLGAVAALGARVQDFDDVNEPASVAWLRAAAPDYVASFCIPQVLGPEVRAVAQRACVNAHPSMLPALRGPDPAFQAVRQGLTHTGVSIHRVVEALDAGELLHQVERPIPPGSSVLGLSLDLWREAAAVLAGCLSGRLAMEARPQAAGGSYHSWPTPQEVRELQARGGKLFRLRELFAHVRRIGQR